MLCRFSHTLVHTGQVLLQVCLLSEPLLAVRTLERTHISMGQQVLFVSALLVERPSAVFFGTQELPAELVEGLLVTRAVEAALEGSDAEAAREVPRI